MTPSTNSGFVGPKFLVSLGLVCVVCSLNAMVHGHPTFEKPTTDDPAHVGKPKKPSETFVLKAISSVPLYRIVGYFTNQTEENEAKVRDLRIPYDMFYTHMYLAWKAADHFMSSISLRFDDPRSPLNGANLVLATSALKDMYAPGLITDVLEFVTRCYEWARPRGTVFAENRAYISVLRSASTPEINRALINQVTEQFLRSTTSGSYHLVWESKTAMGQFMERLNYTRLICGNNKTYENPCDWVDVGLSADVAEDQCLYRLVNQMPMKMQNL